MGYIQVQRRIYLPSLGPPPVSPAYDSMWDDTSSADRRAAVWDAKSSTSFIVLTPSWTKTLASGVKHNVLVRQYVMPAYGSIAADMQAPGPTTPPETSFAPIARMKITATRSGSPIAYGNFHFITWMCAKVVDAAGSLRFVIGRSTSGSGPGLTTLTAREWGVQYLSASNLLLPNATDYLVFELGFRLDNGTAGGTVVFNLNLEFGDDETSDLTNGTTIQKNSHAWLYYFVLDASLAAGIKAGYIKPRSPSMNAVQMSPITDQQDSASTIGNVLRPNSRRANS